MRVVTRAAWRAFALSWLAAACSISPGIKVSGKPAPQDSGGDEVVDAAAYTPKIFEITPQLLARQARERREGASPGRYRSREELKQAYRYLVGVGDVLNVIVWDHPELTNPAGMTTGGLQEQGRLVSDDGTFFFPFVGEVKAAGRSVDEIRRDIATALATYVDNPQVDVRVTAYRSQQVYVTGEVAQPGVVYLDDRPLTILDAVSRAGGFTEAADKRIAYLSRGGEQRRIDVLTLYETGVSDQLLRDGDVLHIPDNRFNQVLVMGEVSRQTRVPLHKGRLSLAEALAEAAGLDLVTANTGRIVVVRGEPVYRESGELEGVRPVVYLLDGREASDLLLAESFQLEPRDIVFVPATTAVRINRVLQQILPPIFSSLQAYWMTDRLIRD